MPLEEASKFQDGPNNDANIMRTAITKNHNRQFYRAIFHTPLGTLYVQTCHHNNVMSRYYYCPHLPDEENEISEIKDLGAGEGCPKDQD